MLKNILFERKAMDFVSCINARCKTCVYVGWLHSGKARDNPFCDYIGRTGFSRPCPAGKQCTQYRKRGGRENGKERGGRKKKPDDSGRHISKQPKKEEASGRQDMAES